MNPVTRIAAMALTVFRSLPAFGAEARKVNILHIHADDHRADGLHALGTPLLQTPNLDALVKSGMTFTSYFRNLVRLTTHRLPIIFGKN